MINLIETVEEKQKQDKNDIEVVEMKKTPPKKYKSPDLDSQKILNEARRYFNSRSRINLQMKNNIEGRFNKPRIRNSIQKTSNSVNNNLLVYSAVSGKGKGTPQSSFELPYNQSIAESQSYYISENNSTRSIPSISLLNNHISPNPMNVPEAFSDIESHQSFNVRGMGYRRIRGESLNQRIQQSQRNFRRQTFVNNLNRSGSRHAPEIIETVNTEPENIPLLTIPENEEEFRLPASVLQPFKSSYNVDDHKNTMKIAKKLRRKGSNPYRFKEVKGLFGGFSHKDHKRFPQAKRFLLKSLRLLQRKQNRQFMSVGARSVCIDLRGDQSTFSQMGGGFARRPRVSNIIPGTVYDLQGNGRAKEVMSCLDDGGRQWNRGRLGNGQSKFMISLEGVSVIDSVKISEHTKDDIGLGKREHISFQASKSQINPNISNIPEFPNIKVLKDEDKDNTIKEETGSVKKKKKTNLNFYSDSKNQKNRIKMEMPRDHSLMNIDLVKCEIDSPMKLISKGLTSNFKKSMIEMKEEQLEPKKLGCIELN
jgi:hypothetical protein